MRKLTSTIGIVKFTLYMASPNWCSHPEEEPDGKMQEANESDKEHHSKDGADYATHVDLLLVRDKGCGYDVSHKEEIDKKVEDQQGDSVLVLPQETTPINWF